jgi:hypothetical protein
MPKPRIHSGQTPKRRKSKNTPGPKPDMLKIEGDWKDAVKKSLEKKKPAQGWPK